jgi:glutamate dehydrogenase
MREVTAELGRRVPTRPDTRPEQLAALAREVLASIDVRDVRDLSARELVDCLESVLETIRVRRSGEIRTAVHEGVDGPTVESCMDDQPFVVSAVRALLAGEGLEIRSTFNAVVRVRRDAAGTLLEVGAGSHESIIWVAVRGTPVGGTAGLQARIRRRLALAQAMVRDFERMKRNIRTAADEYGAAAVRCTGEDSVALRETEGLLRWLCDENFVLLSVEEYGSEGGPGTALGVASVEPPPRDVPTLSRSASGAQARVLYERSAEESPVHRAGKSGQFVVTRMDRSGHAVGALAIDGLFTYKALHAPPEEIPHVRLLLRDLLADRGVTPDGHRGKSITNAFNSLPLEFLLAEPRESVWELTDRVLRAEEEGGSDVHIQLHGDGRSAFVFVTLPRVQYSEELRVQVQRLLLGELGGSYADYGVYMDRYENAILHFYVTGSAPLQVADTERLRTSVHGLAKSWIERLREALAARTPEASDELFEVYVDAFTEEHRRRAPVERLAGDIECLEGLRRGRELECDLFVSTTSEHPGSLNLRVFSRTPLSLSRQLPVIGNFGFEVVDEYTREVRIRHLPTIEMHNFRLAVRGDRHAALLARRAEIVDGLRDVFAGRLGDDSLNRLVSASELDGRDVEVLRAYVAYIHQLRPPFPDELLRQALVDHAGVAHAAVGLLEARFGPERRTGPGVDEAEATLVAELRAVTDYTADRALRVFAEVIRATLRTNAWIADVEAGEALAFKIDGRAPSLGPAPRPLREIWVYHPEFQGVHLRGGFVARGGIRFSDRFDDFRTEIHGLMATQMVKNAVIVPMGAKGGFVLRAPPSGRARLREAGDRYYRVFVSALLSLTDDMVDGTPRTPEGILHREDPDPYLVVAADKGTAHLSDTANALSRARGFWLDDAFASGGSSGYDHKATGITARGAWEAAKRNFRELQIDPESDVVTAIGVGDMSGDVFGNGLLRSRTIALVAAFNHAHVFVDPDPEPASSYQERARLFALPGSAWSDYDPARLSPGGGVWERKAKEIDLPARARARLGIPPDAVVGGDEVVRAILRAEVDLCWMGGIGTYVKSREESHADVGDKANDSVRIDGGELRCRVLAEGANLAITERGRVDFARRGGQGYTAALDNSGGVDLSDHEVNLKILFAPLLASGRIAREERDQLLREVQDEVCGMVLENVRSQSRMVSYDVRASRSDLWRYARTSRWLTAEVPFDPESFAMPSDDELAARFHRRAGLHKCEATVLGAHAKMLAYRQLLAGGDAPPEQERAALDVYFPARVRARVGDEIFHHLLRREIAATVTVNRIVDTSGATFFAEVMGSTGRSAPDVAAAWWRAAEFGDVFALQAELYALEDEHRQDVVYEGMRIVARALEDATYFLLDTVEGDPLAQVEPAPARALLARLRQWLQPGQLQAFEERKRALVEAGLPDALAERVRALRYLVVVLDALRLARDRGRPAEDMLRVRLAVSSAMHLSALHGALAQMRFSSPWDGPAMLALARQLEFHVHKMALLVEDDDVEGMIARFGLEPVRGQLAQHLDGEVSLAAVVMVDNHLRRLLPPKASARGRG